MKNIKIVGISIWGVHCNKSLFSHECSLEFFFIVECCQYLDSDEKTTGRGTNKEKGLFWRCNQCNLNTAKSSHETEQKLAKKNHKKQPQNTAKSSHEKPQKAATKNHKKQPRKSKKRRNTPKTVILVYIRSLASVVLELKDNTATLRRKR